MKKNILGLVLSFVVAGCGSNSAVQDVSGASPLFGASQLSALVRSTQGAPVSGVRVVAQERNSSEQVEGISGADGSANLALADGVYDVALDLEGDPATSTCFYGPVVVSGKTQGDFVLRSSEGRPAGQIFGKLSLTPGIPTAHRQVIVRPGAANKAPEGVDWKAPLTTTTDAQGNFAVNLLAGNAFAVDLEVFDATNGLDEFIDISKREKPCYVEFATEQSSVENVLRCNESPIGTSSRAASLGAAATPKNTPFTSCTINKGNEEMVLDGGNLPPGGGQALLKDLVPSVPSDPNFNNLIDVLTGKDPCSILVDTDHSWYWGKYAVHIHPNTTSDFYFWDATGDRYWVGVGDVSKWHKVSYYSSKPAIVRVDYVL